MTPRQATPWAGARGPSIRPAGLGPASDRPRGGCGAPRQAGEVAPVSHGVAARRCPRWPLHGAGVGRRWRHPHDLPGGEL